MTTLIPRRRRGILLCLTRLSLEFTREQGAQDFTGDPRHKREQQEQYEHEYQHKGGSDKELDYSSTSLRYGTPDAAIAADNRPGLRRPFHRCDSPRKQAARHRRSYHRTK